MPDRLTPSGFKVHVRDDYDAVGRSWEAGIGRLVFRLPAERLVADLAPRRGERALDLACGTGLVARALAERLGPDAVSACDLSPVQVAEARAALAAAGCRSVDVRVMDAERLTYPPSGFQVVACGFGVNHFPRPGIAMRGIHRVLAPGGRAGFSVWAASDHRLGRTIDERLGDALDSRLPASELACERAFARVAERNSRPDVLARLLERSGFVEVSGRSHAQVVDYGDADAFVDLSLARSEALLRAAGLDDDERCALRADLLRAVAPFPASAYRVRRRYAVVVGRRPAA